MSEPDVYRRFEVVQDALHHEQEIFWNRFTGFATLQAGLFVIATASFVQDKWLTVLATTALGMLLSVIWREVQRLSLHYVDRWKPLYHTERKKMGFELADNELGSFVPWLVLIVWVLILLALVLR